MTGWKEEKLENIFYIVKEVYKPSNEHQYKYVGLSHIEQGTLRLNGWGHSNSVQSNKYFFKKDDILFGKLRPYFRKVIKAPFDGVCSTDIWVCRAKKDFDQNFLFYFLANQEFIDTANSTDEGTRMPRADWNYLKKTTWIIPPLPEQKAIAEVLSSLDDKIDLLTRQNNTLEDLGQAFFRKWFVEDADEKLKKYPLSELMVIQNGFAFRSRDYQDAGKYKIVTIKNVQDGFIDTSGTTFLNQLPVGMPDYVLLTIGDVLISLTGNVGRVGIVVEDNLLLNQRVAKISPYNPEYLPFLYFYFRNETTREYLINLAHGTAQANLSPIETLKTEVSFSKTLIKKYSELFMPMYQKIIKNKQQIIVLQKLRDTLLPKLISGEIRLKM